MFMIVRKTLVGIGLVLGGWGASEQPAPDPEGIVVLELPSARTSTASTAKPAASVAGPGAAPQDIDACIAMSREDPFPGGPADPSGGQQYLSGLTAERRGDTQTARKLYLELIQTFPKSSYVPLAYFAFGELFRLEADTDPAKIAFAEQAYNETIKYPAPQNTFWEIAILRAAEVAAMSGDGMKVMSHLQKVAQAGSRPRCAEALGQAVRNMLPPAYADSGRPERAATFFGTFGNAELTATLTARLARLYITQKKNPDALATMRSLASSNVPGGAAMCSEALRVAQELGDPTVVADLAKKCSKQ